MRKHTKEEKEAAQLAAKPFACPNCDTRFVSKESLRKHICRSKVGESNQSEYQISGEFSPTEDVQQDDPLGGDSSNNVDNKDLMLQAVDTAIQK